MTKPLQIAIAGTHSTGKSTFVAAVAKAAEDAGLRVCRIGDIARRARDLGFPILSGHTPESTLWIMAECLRQQAEASLHHDIVLVDRPAIDALGYLMAALEVSGRDADACDLSGLRAIAAADCARYAMIIATVLDGDIALGTGRDMDERFRASAGKHVRALCADLVPSRVEMGSADADRVTEEAITLITRAAMKGPR